MYNFFIFLFLSPIFFIQNPNLKKQKELIKAEENDSLVVASYLDVISLFNPDQTDSIQLYFDEALKYVKKKSYQEGAYLINYKFGKYLSSHGNLIDATYYLNQALGEANINKDKAKIAAVENTLGMIFGKKGEYALATKHLFKSLRLFEELHDINGQVSSYIKLGTISQLNGDFKYALKYADKATEINKKLGDKRYELDLLNNKAIIYAESGDMANALKMFKQTYDRSEGEDKFSFSKVSALINIGLVYKEMQDYDLALSYLKKSVIEAERYNLTNEKVRTQFNIALLLHEKGDYKASNIETLIAVKNARKEVFLDIETESLHLLEENFKALKDYKQALMYSDQHQEALSKLKSVEQNKEIANLRINYDLKKSQQQVELLDQLNKKNEKQKNLILLLFLVCGLSMIIFAVSYYRIRKLSRNQVIQSKLLSESNEFKNKLFSIIGHDLRGAYNSTLGFLHLMKEGDMNKEEEQLFINKVIVQSSVALNTLDNLLLWGHSQIKEIKTYPELFEVNQEIKKSIDFYREQYTDKNITIDYVEQAGVLINADRNHFDFIIRNLLSNAMKFTPNGGNVKVISSELYGQQRFCVADTGTGLSDEQKNEIFSPNSKSTLGTENEKGTGLGLMLCKEFVEKNGGKIWIEKGIGTGAQFCFTLNRVNITV
ncbi:MAG: tetratricopeptide repeat protein [Pelobium sp.]